MEKNEVINAWECEGCLKYTVVVHVDKGVTPFYLACRAEGVEPHEAKCRGWNATSLFYPNFPIPSWILDTVKWEWYKPTPTEFKKLNRDMKEHVKKGGVLLRPLTDAGREVVKRLRSAS